MALEINNTYGSYSATANGSVSKKKNTANETNQSGNVTESSETSSKKYDKVSFSNYLKSVSENGQATSYENTVRQKKTVLNGVNYGDILAEKAYKLNKSDEEALTDGETLSWQTKLDNLSKAYENLRDEIIQGYENGTRQINAADESSETEYRTLTMEEELNSLDTAYEDSVKNFEVLASQQQENEIKGENNSDEPAEKPEEAENDKGSGSKVGINAGKLARMLASAKTRSQIQAVIAKIQSDLQECEAGKSNGSDVDEESVKSAEQLLQEANSRMCDAEDRKATPEEEMAVALASLM